MINLMVGSNYDPILPFKFEQLNKEIGIDIRIAEVYGSIQKLKIFGTARPDFRLPDLTLPEFEDEVSKYKYRDIAVNYTENTPIVDKAKLDRIFIKDKLEYLKGIGVTRITLAHPLAMELTCTYSDMPIEVSTIYAVKNQYQTEQLLKRYPNINKICLDVDQNRDFYAIQEFVRSGVTIELLANEFCLHDCIDRVQCYNEHTQVKSDAETAAFGRYPMGRCISDRMDPIEWLRARFILPQWMAWYKQFAFVDHFKITGRTHPTSYIMWIAEQYMRQDYKGNLLQLWADVKNIKRVSKGQDHMTPTFEIPTNKLTTDILWKYWDDRNMTKIHYEYDALNQLL